MKCHQIKDTKRVNVHNVMGNGLWRSLCLGHIKIQDSPRINYIFIKNNVNRKRNIAFRKFEPTEFSQGKLMEDLGQSSRPAMLSLLHKCICDLLSIMTTQHEGKRRYLEMLITANPVRVYKGVLCSVSTNFKFEIIPNIKAKKKLMGVGRTYP